MIGWENNQGAYFINKLNDKINSTNDLIDNTNDIIGDISDLETTADTDIVSAINELVTRVKALEDAT